MQIREMGIHEVGKLKEIDRSEHISKVYRMGSLGIQAEEANHECGSWSPLMLQELQDRFVDELQHGGIAYGAYAGEDLAGFAVLAHRWLGKREDGLQVDLMYVSRPYRRQGVGKRLMHELKLEAKRRGAKFLYISSTETESAVNFYRHCGGGLTEEVDERLYAKEPEDIHMVIDLQNTEPV